MRSGDECRAGLGDLGGHLGDRGERLAQRRRHGAGGDTRLDFVGEAQQSESLGDALGRDRELLGDLTLVEPAGAHRPVEAASLVDRMVLALEVLHHGERLGLSGHGLAHDRGYLHEPDGRGGREAPVAGDDAEASPSPAGATSSGCRMPWRRTDSTSCAWRSSSAVLRGLKPSSTSTAESGRLRGVPFASVTMTSSCLAPPGAGPIPSRSHAVGVPGWGGVGSRTASRHPPGRPHLGRAACSNLGVAGP